MKSTSKKTINFIIGILLSILGLRLVLQRTSPSEIIRELQAANWLWLGLMICAKIAVLYIKNFRWKQVLKPTTTPDCSHTFRAMNIGYFSNLILPFRLGELMRVGVLKRHNPSVDPVEIFATILAERIMDGIILTSVAAAILPFTNTPHWIKAGTLSLLAIMVLMLCVSILKPLHAAMIKLLPQKGVFTVCRRILTGLSNGTAALRAGHSIGITTFLTALAWVGEALVFWFAVKSIGVPISYASSLIVTLLFAVGLLIPSAPGQVGTHQALAVIFLPPFGILAAEAVSISILLQLITISVIGIFGGTALVQELKSGKITIDQIH